MAVASGEPLFARRTLEMMTRDEHLAARRTY